MQIPTSKTTKPRNRHKRFIVTKSKHSPVKSRPVWTNAYGNTVHANRKQGNLCCMICWNHTVTRNGIWQRWLIQNWMRAFKYCIFRKLLKRHYIVLEAFFAVAGWILFCSCRRECLHKCRRRELNVSRWNFR